MWRGGVAAWGVEGRGCEEGGYQGSPGNNKAIHDSEVFFTTLFTLEAVVKVVAMGFILDKTSYLKDGWNVMDFTVVIISIISAMPGMGNGAGANPVEVDVGQAPGQVVTALHRCGVVAVFPERALALLAPVVFLGCAPAVSCRPREISPMPRSYPSRWTWLDVTMSFSTHSPKRRRARHSQ